MKNVVSLLAIVAFGGMASFSQARPEIPSEVEEVVASPVVQHAFDRLEGMAATLNDSQRAALGQIQGDTAEELLAEVGQILTPKQRRVFDAAMGDLLRAAQPEVSPTEGGWYMPYGCFTVSKVGLVFGVVGFIGCPGDISRDAASLAWGASIFSSACLLEGASSCDLASGAAYVSASGWYQLLTTCSVADTAYYSEAVTYRQCGGDRGGEEPTPDPTPTPAPSTPAAGE